MFLAYFLLSFILISAYVALIVYILHNWYKTPTITSHPSVRENSLDLYKNYNKPISILIAARNEQENIGQCLRSILDNIDVDLYQPEIIVVDDHSTDDTAYIVSGIDHDSIRLLRLEDHIENSNSINAYKKAALNLAVSHASNDLILQLDADVTIPPDFLQNLYGFLSDQNIEFAAGPVKMSGCNKLIHHFQQLDILGMMAVTAAGIQSSKWYMANGANMIYNKNDAVHDTQAIASGDDIYTIQAIAEKHSESVFFIKNKNFIVSTPPMDNYLSLYNQRIRWATKNKTMPNRWMQIMMIIPFLNALLLLAHFIFIIIYGELAVMIFLFHLWTKMAIDYVLLSEMTEYYNEIRSMRYFIPSNLMHVLYICFIGIMSLFVRKYTWKNRKVY